MSTDTENDAPSEAIPLNPDEFRDILWPQDMDIHVYASGTRAVTLAEKGTKIVTSFVVGDDQANPELKAHAGEAVEFWFGTQGRPDERKLYRKLLFAAYGGIPESLIPTDLNGKSFVIQVRHGKPNDEGEVRMFLQALRGDS